MECQVANRVNGLCAVSWHLDRFAQHRECVIALWDPAVGWVSRPYQAREWT